MCYATLEIGARKPVKTYVVVGSRPWNRDLFESRVRHFPGRWFFIGDRDELTFERLSEYAPRHVFFLHWSWIVPPSIVERFECVCFHMTDLPFGRGGSPLQNLIVRGHRGTVLTAFRMSGELDAGPVYLKQSLSLEGSADDIYRRAGEISAEMISRIVTEEPAPVPQTGEVTIFSRRTPGQSEITSEVLDLERLHDHIRMLDADGYPRAFVRVGDFLFTFGRSVLEGDRIRAEVMITQGREGE